MYEANPALCQIMQKVLQLICRTSGSQQKIVAGKTAAKYRAHS
jgi:hypothetical protein